MTGADIRHVRKSLGLGAAHFASVLGVHQSSVHRWEAAGTATVNVEGVALGVLLALQRRVADGSQRVVKDKGREIREALLVGGALAALAALIIFALKGK